MNCLTREQLIFYTLHEFQENAEHAAIQKHLSTCSDCRQHLEATEKKINSILRENEKQCELVLNNLQDYVEGKIDTINAINIADHLAECDTCNSFYQLLNKEVTLEEIKELDIPIPHQLTESIKRLLTKTQVHSFEKIQEARKIINEKANELIDRIVLNLVPAPAPAFLTKVISGEAQIEFFGNAVEVDVGESGRVVKLFSPDDEELSRQISDENGFVVFRDFLPGKYKIVVAGFEIKGAKYHIGH